MRIHEWQVRGPDRSVKELLPETPPTVVGHGILADSMLYLTARRAEDGMLFRVLLNPDDLRRLLHRAMEQDETAAIVREIATPAKAIHPALTAALRLSRRRASGSGRITPGSALADLLGGLACPQLSEGMADRRIRQRNASTL
jgi:hypothetical protein